MGTATKAMRSEKLIKKTAVLPFEGNNIEEFFELEHELLSVGQERHVPHDRKRMVGIHDLSLKMSNSGWTANTIGECSMLNW